jgi:hypothetical protein
VEELREEPGLRASLVGRGEEFLSSSGLVYSKIVR